MTERSKTTQTSMDEDGPVMPGSVLYRALQLVARAIAEKLIAQAAEGKGNSQAKDDIESDG